MAQIGVIGLLKVTHVHSLQEIKTRMVQVDARGHFQEYYQGIKLSSTIIIKAKCVFNSRYRICALLSFWTKLSLKCGKIATVCCIHSIYTLFACSLYEYVLACQIYFHSSRSLDGISRSRTFSLNQVVFRFYCKVTKGSSCRDSFSKVIVVYENLKKNWQFTNKHS